MTLGRGVAILASFAFALAACGDDDEAPERADGRPYVRFPPKEGERVIREIHVSGDLAEGLGATGAAGKLDFRGLLDELSEARTHAGYVGVFVRFRSHGMSWARAGEVAAALARIRNARKPVDCYLEESDTVTYRIAAEGCSRIWLTPAGDLDLVGIASQVVLARRLLDRLGVTPDLLHVGRYKGAADTFMLDEISPETRETLDAVLDETFAELVDSVARGRNIAPDRVRALIDEGPFDSDRAMALGLVDRIAFDDEALTRARNDSSATRVAVDETRPAPTNLLEIVSSLSADAPEEPTADRIALVHVTGAIVHTQARGGGFGGISTVGSGPFVQALRRFSNDAAIKAVVLRIDSPGGSALASDLIWHAVRRVARRKPVVASIGDMGASGGYYIAAGATRILARRSSLVGSIGVVGGKVSLHRLAERWGVRVATLRRGRRAAWTTALEPFSADERAAFQRGMERTYARFVSRVRSSRQMPRERVAAAAEGRLWTGGAARRVGLIDEEGGLLDAIARARSLGRLGADAPIEEWPPRPTLAEAFSSALGSEGDAVAAHEALPGDLAWLRHVPPGAWSSGAAALVLPLLDGEQTVAALPFVLVGR
ncbi:MAG: signal peptide peptidase SppA [Deltaproteobacteria bacterium]|nr:signal peptide peptidase SppA [Deltaproteobacteria bacterium]